MWHKQWAWVTCGYSKLDVNGEQLVCRSKDIIITWLSKIYIKCLIHSFIHATQEQKNHSSVLFVIGAAKRLCVRVAKNAWTTVNDDIFLANILTSCLMCELLLSNGDIQQPPNVSGRSRSSLRFPSAFDCAVNSLEWLIGGDRFYVFYFKVTRCSAVKPERDWFRQAKEGLQFCWTVHKINSKAQKRIRGKTTGI